MLGDRTHVLEVIPSVRRKARDFTQAATLALRFQGETDKVKWMPFQAKGTAPTRHLQGKRASMLNYKLFSRGWDSEGWLESKRGRQITQGLSALAGLVSPQFRPVVLTL